MNRSIYKITVLTGKAILLIAFVLLVTGIDHITIKSLLVLLTFFVISVMLMNIEMFIHINNNRLSGTSYRIPLR